MKVFREKESNMPMNMLSRKQHPRDHSQHRAASNSFIHNINLESWSWEDVSVKCLAHNHEDLSSNPQHPSKKPTPAPSICNPRPLGKGGGLSGSLEPSVQPTREAYFLDPRFRSAVLKCKVESKRGKQSVTISSIHKSVRRCVLTHTCSPIQKSFF